MIYGLGRSWTLLFFGLLLPWFTGCGPSVTGVSEPQTVRAVPQYKILQDPIKLDPSLAGHVKTVRFFEGERSQLAFSKQRAYESRFARATTRTIYTEIHLEHPQPGKRIYFPITLHFRQNGKIVRIEEFEGRLGPDWTSSDQLVAVGDFAPGNWRLGNYEVDVYIIAEKVATGYFEIY